MGMFDTIIHQDPRIICPNGHILKELQTKDLECSLKSYAIRDDQLWCIIDGWGSQDYEFVPYLTTVTDGLDCYTSCHICEDKATLHYFLIVIRTGEIVSIMPKPLEEFVVPDGVILNRDAFKPNSQTARKVKEIVLNVMQDKRLINEAKLSYIMESKHSTGLEKDLAYTALYWLTRENK